MGLSVPGACQRCCSLCSLLSAAAEEGSYNLDPLHPHYWTFLPFFSEDIVATTASVLWTRPPRTSARGVTASFWRHTEPQQKRSAAAAAAAKTSSLEVGPAGLRRNAQTPGVSG